MRAKTKRNIFYAVLLAAILLFCGYKIIMRIKEDNEQKVRLDTASANAVGYIREKYGFEPELLDASDDYLFELYNKYHDDVRILKMKADGREFYVLADCLEENSYCADDYQRDEIETAAKNEILKMLPEGGDKNVRWTGTGDIEPSSLRLHCFFNTYFDGGNIDEFMEKGVGEVNMTLLNMNISESDIPDKLEKINVGYFFISFDKSEVLEAYNAGDISYRMYAPYITDHISNNYFSNGERKRVSYKTKEIDNLKYCCFEFDTSLNEIEQSEFIRRRDYHGRMECLKQPVSKAYEVENTVSGKLYIYYPLDELNGVDVKHIGAVWRSREGTDEYIDYKWYDRKTIGTEKAEICGDYAVFILPERTSEFMLADLREQTQ